MRQSLLFIDMLGVRTLWHEGGTDAATIAFIRLREIVETALMQLSYRKHVLVGEMESDSVVLICDNVRWAVKIGRAIFREAFVSTNDLANSRIWLRGAIVPYDGASSIRIAQRLDDPLAQVRVHEYHPSLLEVVSIEKSGIKGMRLVVAIVESKKKTRKRLRYPVAGRAIPLVTRLHNLPYPERLSDFMDVFWMASETEEEWNLLNQIMDRRMRWAAKVPEEFIHAAATRVLFSECGAYVGSTLKVDKVPMTEV